MKNKVFREKNLPIFFALLCLLIFTFYLIRVNYVNADVSNIAAASAQNKPSTPTESSPTAEYSLGEPIDISGLTMNKRTAPEGVSITFSNSTLMTVDDIYAIYPDWSLTSSNLTRYNKPEFLVVDATFHNAGVEESPILWFKLTSSSWSTIIDPNDTRMFNGDDHIEQYKIQPGEDKTVKAVYMIQKDTMSKEQWDHVNSISFDAVLLDYPEQVSVRVWDGENA
jgi:hypothetical protein